MHPSLPTPETRRAHAREAAQAGEMQRARDAYSALLSDLPGDLESLNFLATLELAEGRPEQAEALLDRALAAAPGDVPTLKNQGVLLFRTGRFREAERVLCEAVSADPEFFVARLYLGATRERLGRSRVALVDYFRAITSAQSSAAWTSPSTTPAGLRPLVERAIVVTRNGRRQVLSAVLSPFRERFGAGEIVRVERCLAGYLGDLRVAPRDAAQRPEFLYFPDLPSSPFLPRDLFPWYAQMEDATPAIREELIAALDDDPQLQPFLGEPPPGMKSSYLDASRPSDVPQWDAFFFHRHGQRFERNCARCPGTVAALEAAPLVHIPGHAPEALFSVLGPGSHILPHCGVTNTRVVTHLPLIVPETCRLRVAGEEHAWQPGRCITFDDTFEHEAWNDSGHTRVILLFDVWNPHLTEIERLALTELVPAIGDFGAETA